MQLAGLLFDQCRDEILHGKRMRPYAAPAGGALSTYLLRLFVTGASARTAIAIANLQRICEQELEGRYEIQIIDVLEFPEIAENERILATPTLLKTLPLPLRRVIGDLSDTERVLLGLDVQPTRGDGANDKGVPR